MKFWQQLILLLVAICGLNLAAYLFTQTGWRPVPERFNGSLQLIHPEPTRNEPLRYEFHYAGAEKWNNVFVVYRMDRLSGKVQRMAYAIYEPSKEGFPAYSNVETTDLEDGKMSWAVAEKDKPTLADYFDQKLKRGAYAPEATTPAAPAGEQVEKYWQERAQKPKG